MNGGKDGNSKKLQAPWCANQESADADEDGEAVEIPGDDTCSKGILKRKFHIVKDEESVRKRRPTGKLRWASVAQVEEMYVCAGPGINVPERDWGNGFSGTNKGTMIGPVKATAPAEDWQTTIKDKRSIFGKCVRLVGGTEQGAAAVEKKKQDSTVELVFHMVLPMIFYRALMQGFLLKCVCDLTPGNGASAEGALLSKIGYVALCMTEKHATCLRERLVLFVIAQMLLKDSPLYDAKCAAALRQSPTPTASSQKRKPNDGEKPGPKKKACPKGKAQAKKEAKTTTKTKEAGDVAPKEEAGAEENDDVSELSDDNSSMWEEPGEEE